MNTVHLSYPHHITDFKITGPFSLAIGFFDGVHRGHREVIEHAKRVAEERGLKLAVMTFDPHPSIVLGKRNEKVFYITPLEQKLELLQSLGVDTTFVVRFTSDFAQLTPENFVDTFIRQLNVKHVSAGYDFTFGAFGQGNMDVMKQLAQNDFHVSVVEKKSVDSEKISSTRIRQALTLGNMENVLELLGRPFQIPGIVVNGDKRGRTIGFPTANIQAKEGFYIPATGVYAVRMLVQDEWVDGVCNVGYKPTFKNPDEKQLTIEVHLFDFDKNIYGEEVFVDWYHHIRDERKFDGIESLKHQIEKDKQTAMLFLQNSN